MSDPSAATIDFEMRPAIARTSPLGTTRRFEPIAPFVAFLLLSGCRVGEALTLKWEAIDLDALDGDSKKVGEIHLKAADVKTAQARVVDLSVTPALRALLAAMKLRAGKNRFVFGGRDSLPYSAVEGARKRLRTEYGAPTFSWQNLRQTTASFLTNAPSIFGSASAYRSAAQLGHAVEVAQRRYVGLVRGISRDARTVEAAMQIEPTLQRVLSTIGSVPTRATGAPLALT